jgi:hypothetical protein
MLGHWRAGAACCAEALRDGASRIEAARTDIVHDAGISHPPFNSFNRRKDSSACVGPLCKDDLVILTL